CFPNCHSKINKWLYSTSPMLMKLRGMQEFKVRKGIAEEAADSAFRLTKITNDLSKGKGHIVDYLDPAVTTPTGTLSEHKSITNVLEEVAESSAANGEALSAPVLACSDFQMGPSSGGRVTASSSSKKNQRRRPPSWKRKTGTRPVDPQTFSTQVISTQQRMKRKSSPPPSSSDHKTLKITKTLCRLDRCFGNDEWYRLFPRSHVEYMAMYGSDHRPLRIDFALESDGVS
ncbi:unnamed protein product, partial [Brassica oleracea]